jgi:hypothetical protein
VALAPSRRLTPACRFPKTAPGPFYSTGECLACGAPEEAAPDLLAPLEGPNYDTYFIRQPTTPAEFEAACNAVQVCCVDALRYGGRDPAILHRLGNTGRYCDHPEPHWWQFWRRSWWERFLL